MGTIDLQDLTKEFSPDEKKVLVDFAEDLNNQIGTLLLRPLTAETSTEKGAYELAERVAARRVYSLVRVLLLTAGVKIGLAHHDEMLLADDDLRARLTDILEEGFLLGVELAEQGKTVGRPLNVSILANG